MSQVTHYVSFGRTVSASCKSATNHASNFGHELPKFFVGNNINIIPIDIILNTDITK